MNSKKTIILSALLMVAQPADSMEEGEGANRSIYPHLRNYQEIEVNSTQDIDVQVTKKKIEKKSSSKRINTKKLDLTIKGYENLPTGSRPAKKAASKKIVATEVTENKLKRKPTNTNNNAHPEDKNSHKKTKRDIMRETLERNREECDKQVEASKRSGKPSYLRNNKLEENSPMEGVLVSSPADWRFGVHAPLQGLEEGVEQQFSISDDSSEG